MIVLFVEINCSWVLWVDHVIVHNLDFDIPLVKNRNTLLIQIILRILDNITNERDFFGLFKLFALFIDQLVERAVIVVTTWNHIELDQVEVLSFFAESSIDFSCELFANVYDIWVIDSWSR